MWPFTHLAIGYLLYTAYTHGRFRRPPYQFAAVLVLIGTQFADLIDKPLALVGIVASGRSLGHSYLVVIPVVVLVGGFLYWRLDTSDYAVAFGLSYLSAPIADGAQLFLQGDLATDIREVSFWVWPLNVPAERIVEHLQVTPTVKYAITHKAEWTAENIPVGEDLKFWIRLFEVSVTLLAIGVWMYDGFPGGEVLREVAGSARQRVSAAGRQDNERR